MESILDVDVELVYVDVKNPARKEYVLRGPRGEVGLRIAIEGAKRQLNMVGVNWGEGWKQTWDGDEELKDLVLNYTGATFNSSRIDFFRKIYQMQLFSEPKITQQGENETFTFEGPTDTTVVTKRRREQPGLRKYLLGRGELEACAICGTSLPPEFLIVAHIKKRSKASDEERKDENIVLPMCKFGCDALFEHGWIGVENGNVVPIRRDGTDWLVNKISELLGKRVPSWNGPAQVYFRWHAIHHRRTID
ncbi:hypothetical protein M2444_005590 [Paenibacillus sp. PastF-3]|uniref:hypothetical protein n=1 Tax=Paenibacillus sp. PastF-3 TaxID=2940626 RepID=UPI0024731764|nr:hypothetical protein [Paenibacillus sp. PastF-3]MDH6373747.1 hypothetical protein [Paenibacillus sp. PastF-3]